MCVAVYALAGCVSIDSAPVASDSAPGVADSTPASDVPRNTLDSWPQDGRPVFIGFANRLLDREQEVAAALQNAAEQIVRFEHLTAVYQYVSQTDRRRTGSVDAVSTQWDEARAAGLVDSLEVIGREQTHDGTRVTVLGHQALSGAVQPAPGVSGSRSEPAWITQPPVIPGYIVGVGAAQRRRSMTESFAAADERALVDILLQTNATVRLLDESRTRARSTETLTTVAQDASAELTGFLVLARYMSPNGRTFHSLAIAVEGR